MEAMKEALRFVLIWGGFLAIILIPIWPLLALAAGTFSEGTSPTLSCQYMSAQTLDCQHSCRSAACGVWVLRGLIVCQQQATADLYDHANSGSISHECHDDALGCDHVRWCQAGCTLVQRPHDFHMFSLA